MPAFGTRSRAVLATVDPRLVKVLEEVVKYRDITVISGFRGEAVQNQYFAEGRSTKRWPHSKHNRNAAGELQGPSMAVDIAPWPIRWKDLNEFIYVAGMVMQAAHTMGVKVRCGINWDMDDDILDDQTFQDYGHFELVL